GAAEADQPKASARGQLSMDSERSGGTEAPRRVVGTILRARGTPAPVNRRGRPWTLYECWSGGDRRQLGSQQLLLLGDLPCVPEAEPDQDRHNRGERERGDRAPQHDRADRREGVGLEQQTPQRGAGERGVLERGQLGVL